VEENEQLRAKIDDLTHKLQKAGQIGRDLYDRNVHLEKWAKELEDQQLTNKSAIEEFTHRTREEDILRDREIHALNRRIQKRDDHHTKAAEERDIYREQVNKLKEWQKEDEKLRQKLEGDLQRKVDSYNKLKADSERERREHEQDFEKLRREYKDMSRQKSQLFLKYRAKEDEVQDLHSLVTKQEQEIRELSTVQKGSSLETQMTRQQSGNRDFEYEVFHLTKQLEDSKKFLDQSITHIEGTSDFEDERSLRRFVEKVRKYLHFDDDTWEESTNTSGPGSGRERKEDWDNEPPSRNRSVGRVDVLVTSRQTSGSGWDDESDDEKYPRETAGGDTPGQYGDFTFDDVDARTLARLQKEFTAGRMRPEDFEALLKSFKEKTDKLEDTEIEKKRLEAEVAKQKTKYKRSQDIITVRIRFRSDQKPSTSLDIGRQASIGMLKEKVAELKGTTTDKIRLVFNGRQLANETEILEDIGLDDDEIITVVVASETLNIIGVIRDSERRHEIMMTAEPKDTVDHLKIQVFKQFYCFPEDVGIYLHKRELDSRRTLRDHGIDDGVRVEIRIKERVLTDFMRAREKLEGLKLSLKQKEAVYSKLRKELAHYISKNSYQELEDCNLNIDRTRSKIKKLRRQIDELEELQENKKEKLKETISRTRKSMTEHIGTLEELMPFLRTCIDHHRFKEFGRHVDRYHQTWQRYDILDQQMNTIRKFLPDHYETIVTARDQRYNLPAFIRLVDGKDREICGFYERDGSFCGQPRWRHVIGNYWIRVIRKGGDWVVINHSEYEEGARTRLMTRIRISLQRRYSDTFNTSDWESTSGHEPPDILGYFD